MKNANQIPALVPAEIVQIPLDALQYTREEKSKTQIVLHHSAGWDNARNMFAGWAADKQRVATAFGVVDDGTIHQAFGSQYWAWHINFLSKGNAANRLPQFRPYVPYRHAESLEMHSIGYEICNWGPLTFENGRFYTYLGTTFKDEKKVVQYPKKFRGFEFFERYTDAEIESIYKLIRYHASRYGIPTTYNPDMWDVSTRAVGGVPGIWAHVSYRSDKCDVHPQGELVDMLKSL